MSDYPEPFYNDETSLAVSKPKLKRPPLYKVIILNDDYTTMDFVVHVLRHIFHHNQEKAEQIMLHIHQKGAGVCGIYTREVAETKVEQVAHFAQEEQHPLQCVMEPEAESEGEE